MRPRIGRLDWRPQFDTRRQMLRADFFRDITPDLHRVRPIGFGQARLALQVIEEGLGIGQLFPVCVF